MRRLIDTTKDLCPACRDRIEGEVHAQVARVRATLRRPEPLIPSIYIEDPDGRKFVVEGVAGG
jgi:uncharacterized radical SAM superfamily Fe-S cluster-containing enzyme